MTLVQRAFAILVLLAAHPASASGVVSPKPCIYVEATRGCLGNSSAGENGTWDQDKGRWVKVTDGTGGRKEPELRERKNGIVAVAGNASTPKAPTKRVPQRKESKEGTASPKAPVSKEGEASPKAPVNERTEAAHLSSKEGIILFPLGVVALANVLPAF
ncbi:hypothetical protein TRVL_09590 [Trypanosoma vivax]|nr:hypothetical protein TRVL_09590 [Trypanosoma vivax]